MADVLKWLVPCSLANLEVLDLLTNLDNNTGTLVACAFRAQLRHLGQSPVVHHEMDIGHAETGGIELDQNIFRTCLQCQ